MADPDPKEMKGFLGWLKDRAPLVAYVSLILGGFMLYQSHIKPFCPQATFGAITLIPKPIEGQQKFQLILGVQATINNAGARPGIVEDLAIEMKSVPPETFHAMFYPYTYYDAQKMLEDKYDKKPDLFSLKGIFTGIYLPARENVYKEILFGMEPVPESARLLAGKYDFVFYLRKAGGEYSVVTQRQEIIAQDTINNFGSTAMTALLPYTFRDNFTKAKLK